MIMSSDAVALDVMEASHVAATIVAFRDALVAHCDVINDLNVYPVPDGDTGSNMSLTLGSVVEELESADGDMAAVCKAISHGSFMGGRGNSGVILSQILMGATKVLGQAETASVAVWNEALAAAATAAYGAVPKPVEGTILTVVREVSEACAELDDSVTLVDFFEVAKDAGAVSLANTPKLLPQLADAGVVDAGGAGFLLLIDAALTVIDGRPLPEPPASSGPAIFLSDDVTPGDDDHTDISDLKYEVMFFLDAPDDSIEGFKAAWGEIGDSIVVVGGDGIWNCHIHCDDIGAAMEAGIAVGRPHKIRVTDLIEELEHIESMRAPAEPEEIPEVTYANPNTVTTAVVAVGVGEGVRKIFESLGVQAVVTGGQSANPSTELLLRAANAVPADNVVILPNNKNIIAVAKRVNEATDKSVGVIPTRGIAEGFAALLAFDPGAQLVGNVAQMSQAAGSVIAGEVTQAVRDSKSDAGPIAQGDWLGLTRGGITTIEKTLVDAMCAMLDHIVDADDHEIVTIITGADADEATTAAVAEWLETNRPDVEVEIHFGGQPLYPFYVGVE